MISLNHMSQIGKIYSHHHGANRNPGFTIMELERSEFLKKNIGTGKKVLDIGCRNGVLTKHFADGNVVWGVDIDPVALEEAKKLLQGKNAGNKFFVMDLLADWEELNGEKFDVIVCGEVLEHLYFPDIVLGKVAKHLKEGGIFLGSVPNAFSLRNRIRYAMGTKKYTPVSDPTHINHFEWKELTDLMKKHFSKVELSGFGRFTRLVELFPKLFAFDIIWRCEK
jgi:2-polyprenyl-3-methyl-5-hydroxy-6-metoxy-1,4-benzoquinol methylase